MRVWERFFALSEGCCPPLFLHFPLFRSPAIEKKSHTPPKAGLLCFRAQLPRGNGQKKRVGCIKELLFFCFLYFSYHFQGGHLHLVTIDFFFIFRFLTKPQFLVCVVVLLISCRLLDVIFNGIACVHCVSVFLPNFFLTSCAISFFWSLCKNSKKHVPPIEGLECLLVRGRCSLSWHRPCTFPGLLGGREECCAFERVCLCLSMLRASPSFVSHFLLPISCGCK